MLNRFSSTKGSFLNLIFYVAVAAVGEETMFKRYEITYLHLSQIPTQMNRALSTYRYQIRVTATDREYCTKET